MSEPVSGNITNREAELISQALNLGGKREEASRIKDDDLEAQIMALNIQLRDARTELEILHRNMPGGIMTYDADTGKILYVKHSVPKALNGRCSQA